MCLGAPFYQTEALAWPHGAGRASAVDQITPEGEEWPLGVRGGWAEQEELRKECIREGTAYDEYWKVPVGSKAIGDQLDFFYGS